MQGGEGGGGMDPGRWRRSSWALEVLQVPKSQGGAKRVGQLLMAHADMFPSEPDLVSRASSVPQLPRR